ncbi:MFS transporter [Brooklawnia cerclae]|uniref:Multidrug efflux pump Tap n=1 Tax=Brooklawnia cerclae TaxID=349934 RepID=A0ABX0SJB3_9ACTN|nr:MFS transporter [Brooklawnia cerclae]NIH57398.1 MFS family permease [Brooklawnia cerclae]
MTDADVATQPTGTMRRRAALPVYLAATAASMFGNASIMIVLPWLVLERTGDPALAGTIAAISAVPSIFATILGGQLIDRVGRRAMSVLSDIGSAVSVAALAIVDATVGLDVAWFIVLGILGALFDVPGSTARETLIANVAEASEVSIDQAASGRQSVFGVAMLAGPAVAGFLLAVMPSIQVVWITAVCSGLAALLIAVMPLKATTRVRAADDDSSAWAGWHLIRGSRPLIILTVIYVASQIAVAPLLSVILPAHFTSMGRSEFLGLSLSGFAVGTVAGSIVYGAVLARRRWSAWVAAIILLTVGFGVIAVLHGFVLVAVGMVVAGVGQGLFGPIVSVMLVVRVPDALRGRVMALLTAAAMVGSPIGLGLTALIVAAADIGVGAWVMAALWVPVAVLSVWGPGLRTFIEAEPSTEDESSEISGIVTSEAVSK